MGLLTTTDCSLSLELTTGSPFLRLQSQEKHSFSALLLIPIVK
jgi:hypothetical protein